MGQVCERPLGRQERRPALEVGDELWGSWNTGYPAQDEIGARTQAFSEAVRKVDPNARLIATGADPDHYHTSNAVAGDSTRYLSVFVDPLCGQA